MSLMGHRSYVYLGDIKFQKTCVGIKALLTLFHYGFATVATIVGKSIFPLFW